MLYSEFAVHCDAERGPNGDPLDGLGNAAALIFSPGRGSADKDLALSAKAAVDGKPPEAAALLQLVPPASEGALRRGFRATTGATERGKLPKSVLCQGAHLLRKVLGKREADGFYATMVLQPGDPQEPNSCKVRRGKVGGYLDDLLPEQIAVLDHVVDQALDNGLGYRTEEHDRVVPDMQTAATLAG